MQQPQEPELSFAQVKQQVNLIDLALSIGYQHNRTKSGESTEKGKFHVFDYKGQPGLDRVIIFKAPSGDSMYFNPQDDRDKGSVIDFVKFRVENPKVDSITSTPGKSVWFDVIDNCKRFLNIPPQQRQYTQIQKEIKPIEPGAGFNINLDKCRPLDDTRYLNNRGLSNETLYHPLFRGRILNHVHTGKTKAGDTYSFTNTAFPQMYKNRVVGLEIKANGFKGQAPDSLNASSLWLSNTPERAKVVVLSESAIDSLSHYQLHKPENTIYASTSGNLTDNKIFELQRVVQDNNLSTVKLALDNNLEGHIFDTKAITGLATETNPMRIIHNQPTLLSVSVHAVDSKPVLDLVREVKRFNLDVTENYKQAGGGDATASATLNTELISSNKEGQFTYQFHVPKRPETLAFFNQALIKAFPLSVKVEINKSQANDWNDQLKDSLKAQVQRPQLTTEQRPASSANQAPTSDAKKAPAPKGTEKTAEPPTPSSPRRGMKM